MSTIAIIILNSFIPSFFCAILILIARENDKVKTANFIANKYAKLTKLTRISTDQLVLKQKQIEGRIRRIAQ